MKKWILILPVFMVAAIWAGDIVLFVQTPDNHGITWVTASDGNLVASFALAPTPTPTPAPITFIEFNNPTNSAGTNGYASREYTAAFEPSTPWTWEAWVAKVGDCLSMSYSTSGFAVMGVLSLDTGGMGLYANNVEVATYNTDVQTPLRAFHSTTIFSSYYVWHHLAVTADGSTSKIWIDGSQVYTNAQDWDLGGTRNSRFYLARGYNATGDGYGPFRLKMVRISSVARYTGTFTPYTAFTNDGDTIALWKCDEGSGTTLNDSSGNGYSMIISNTGYKWISE